MTLPNLQALENEWAQFTLDKTGPRGQWTQDQRWRWDNPVAYQQLVSYRTGGSRPVLPPGTGARMVWHVDAYLQAKGSPVGWTCAPPQGTLTDQNGNGVLEQWRFDYTVGPVTVEKQHIHDYTDYGYGLMQWVNNQPVESPPGVRSTIRDLRIERITRQPPRSSDGTAEACLWVGQTADVSRVELVAGAWMQLWLGARSYRGVHSDIRMTDTRLVGIYPEHQTWDSTIRRFVNEQSPAQLGNVVNQEWAYGGEFSKNLTYDQFDLYVPAGQYAFFLDAGNGGNRVAPSPGSRVWGPGSIAAFPLNIVPGLGPNQIWLENIDMTGLEGNRQVVYHNNAIGTFTQRVAAATRGLVGLAPKLHPGTIRMPQPLAARLA